jgi:hypothetical protein
MVAPIRNNSTTVLAIQASDRNGGVFIALIPNENEFEAEDINDALQEAGIESPQRVCEILNWKKTSNGVRVGFLPLPTSK